MFTVFCEYLSVRYALRYASRLFSFSVSPMLLLHFCIAVVFGARCMRRFRFNLMRFISVSVCYRFRASARHGRGSLSAVSAATCVASVSSRANTKSEYMAVLQTDAKFKPKTVRTTTTGVTNPPLTVLRQWVHIDKPLYTAYCSGATSPNQSLLQISNKLPNCGCVYCSYA